MRITPLTYKSLPEWEWVELDEWAAFDASSSLTYSNFIGVVDAALPTLTKVNLGDSANASLDLYRYTAGRGAARVLLIGGTHGNEKIGIAAAFRWFTWFATSTHRLAVLLRNVLTVIYIPVLNPSGYRATRRNANDVDINRNYDWYWSAYTPPSSSFAKGDAAFDQPENIIVKGLLDDNDIRCVVDCHDFDSSGAAGIWWSAPSPWTLGNRPLVTSAVNQWKAIYDPDGDYTNSDLTPNSGEPMLVNWSSYYLRHVLGRRNAGTIAIECYGDLLGTTSTVVSRAALQLYCGFLTIFLLRWLADGQREPMPHAVLYRGTRDLEETPTSIATGGTLIDTSDDTALSFTTVRPTSNTNTAQTAINVVVPVAPAVIVMRARGYIESGGTGGRINLYIDLDGTRIENSYTSIEVPATSGDRIEFVTAGYAAVASLIPHTIHTVELHCWRQESFSSTLKFYSMDISIEPNLTDWAVPIVNP